MLYRVNATFEAVSCEIKFQKEGRLVVLRFDGPNGAAWIMTPEYVMAEIVGQFIKQRLFGLH